MLASCVAVSPNGRWVATGNYDDRVIIWEAESLNVHVALDGHSHDLRTLAFSSDSTMLASAGRDKVIRVWNVADGTSRGIRESGGGAIRSLAWISSNEILEGNSDGYVVGWTADGESTARMETESFTMALSPETVHGPLASCHGS